jgi:hypothetical protein
MIRIFLRYISIIHEMLYVSILRMKFLFSRGTGKDCIEILWKYGYLESLASLHKIKRVMEL